VTAPALAAALDRAATLAAANAPAPEAVIDLVLEILDAASDTPAVQAELRDVPAGRALLRFTDGARAVELQAGEGRLSVIAAEPKGKGPKVDATAAVWLGLLGGTLKPWLAFTRGQVVCRAGISELRWLQQVAERLQRGYADARQSPAQSAREAD
jgi:hypothetical protein